MITASQIQIYKKFNGDIDDWARSGSKVQKNQMSDLDWSQIEELRQRFFLINSGSAAESYIIESREKLTSLVEKDAIDLFMTLIVT